MTFQERKAKLLALFKQFDVERAFESDAQREYVLARLEDATNMDMLCDPYRELSKICHNEIKDLEWVIEQTPVPEIDLDEIKKELEESKLLADPPPNGFVTLYRRWTEHGYSSARLEGSGNELVLTEEIQADATTTIRIYRISTNALVELVKKHGKRE